MNLKPTTQLLWRAILLLLPALVLSTSVSAATAHGAFSARITVTSQCNTQQALFGPQAEHNVTIICQPGMTPYQTSSLDLGDDSKKTTGNTQMGQTGQNVGGTSFTPSTKKVLSPPLPSSATFASKVIFVVF